MIENPYGHIYYTFPIGYLDSICLIANARLILTDSGGLQEETTYLGIPCITLRPNTERPVTISQGTNRLAQPGELGALLASVAVWALARKAAVWSGGSENWDALFLFVFGGGVMVVQVVIALAGLILFLCNIKKWTRREKWVCGATIPLPVISSLLAFAHSSPFYA